MSLMDQEIILHFRGEVIGQDPFKNPIYGPPRDEAVPGWFEPAGSTEDLAAANQSVKQYWVYTEDSRITSVDAITLPTPHEPLRCELAPPQWQPEGVEVPGYVRVLATHTRG